MVQRRLTSQIAGTISKQRFGGRNGFSTAHKLVKLISHSRINQIRDHVTPVLVIVIKGTFHNMYKGILLQTMSDMDLPEAFRR